MYSYETCHDQESKNRVMTEVNEKDEKEKKKLQKELRLPHLKRGWKGKIIIKKQVTKYFII